MRDGGRDLGDGAPDADLNWAMVVTRDETLDPGMSAQHGIELGRLAQSDMLHVADATGVGWVVHDWS